MHCYICEHGEGAGGTRYAIREAIGVCHHCGVGLCEGHAHKGRESGSLLLCGECDKLMSREKTEELREQHASIS